MNLAERVRPSTLVEGGDQIQARGRIVGIDASTERREQSIHACFVALRASCSIAGFGFAIALHGSNAVACVVRIAIGAQKAEFLQALTVPQRIASQRADRDVDEELRIIVESGPAIS